MTNRAVTITVKRTGVPVQRRQELCEDFFESADPFVELQEPELHPVGIFKTVLELDGAAKRYRGDIVSFWDEQDKLLADIVAARAHLNS